MSTNQPVEQGVSNAQPSDQGIPNARGRKGVHWRRDPVILARLEEVERRRLRGQANVHIAAALGVDEGTIRNDLKRLQELWQERTGATIIDLRARAVAELDEVKRRAIEAAEFDRDMELAVLFGVGDRPVIRDEHGSARFFGQKAQALNVYRQAVMDQARILGLVTERRELRGSYEAILYRGVDTGAV